MDISDLIKARAKEGYSLEVSFFFFKKTNKQTKKNAADIVCLTSKYKTDRVKYEDSIYLSGQFAILMVMDAPHSEYSSRLLVGSSLW